MLYSPGIGGTLQMRRWIRAEPLMRRLRKKLPDINIQTIYGFGYRLS